MRIVTYYPVAGAMRIVDSLNNKLYYNLTDHFGSASVVTYATGTIVGEQRYYPYGETRWTAGCTKNILQRFYNPAIPP